MTNKILDKIKTRECELGALYKRMDATKNLLYLTSFVMKHWDGKTPIQDVINVTLNSPAVFANNIINDLSKAKIQTKVEGDISDTAKNMIENYIDDVFAQIDEQLNEYKGIVDLQSWLACHVTCRGPIGGVVISQVLGGEYVVDVLPYDMRYAAWQFGRKGLDWISYRTKKDQRMIYDDYGIQVTDKNIECVEYYDNEVNRIFFGNDEIQREVEIDGKTYKYPQSLPYGKCPGIVVLPATGFMLRDTDYLEHEAEDILFMNKTLYDEINRLVSILQTKAYECLLPGMVQEVEVMETKPADDPPGLGQVKRAKKDYGWKPVERPDINNSFINAEKQMEKALQEGGYNALDLGNASESVNAIWITTQNEIRQKFLRPRKRAIEVFKQQIARKLINQLKIVGSGEMNIGKLGKRRAYNATKIADPTDYDISFILMVKNKQMEIANSAVAASLWDKLPYKWILDNIMMAENPEEIISEMEMERAKRADPTIGILHMAIQYAREAKKLTGNDAKAMRLMSKQLTYTYYNMVVQRSIGGMQDMTRSIEPKQPNTNALAAAAARGL